MDLEEIRHADKKKRGRGGQVVIIKLQWTLSQGATLLRDTAENSVPSGGIIGFTGTVMKSCMFYRSD